MPDLTNFAGINVGKEADQFFQSDADIQIAQRRDTKRQQTAQRGDPFTCSSKVLSIALIPSASLDSVSAYVGESGFIIRRVNLSVCPQSHSMPQTKKTVKIYKGHSGPVTCVAVDPTAESVFYSGSWDKTIKKWNAQDPYAPGETGKPRLLLFSGSADSSIRVWDAETGEHLRKLEGHRRGIECVVVDSEGRFLYSSSSDGTIRKFEIKTGECVAVFQGHDTSVYGLKLVEDEEELWSASADHTVRRWDLNSAKCTVTFKHADWVKCFTLVGPYLITGSRDENVRIWDLATEKVKYTIEGHCDEVSALIATGPMLYSASYDATVRQWSLQDKDLKTLLTADASTAAVPISKQPQKTKEPKMAALTEDEERELAELMSDDE